MEKHSNDAKHMLIKKKQFSFINTLRIIFEDQNHISTRHLIDTRHHLRILDSRALNGLIFQQLSYVNSEIKCRFKSGVFVILATKIGVFVIFSTGIFF